MTMTVKLELPLELALRKRADALGRSASAVMREALQAYLAKTEPSAPSAYALGQDLFGKHAGTELLATQRKTLLHRVWDEKRAQQPAQSKRL